MENGLCKIAITGEDYLGCGASAGEIKSYSVNPLDSIHSWTLDYGFYLEIRVKNLPIQEGTGSAGWLFAGGQPEYNEIDIWETDGKHKHKYGSTYWWDESSFDCSNEKGLKQDHSVFRVRNLSDRFAFLGINLWSRKMDLTDNWLVYGVDWNEDRIKYYLNGVKTKEVIFSKNFNEKNPCKIDVNDRPLYAKNIRIGTGPNSLGDKESTALLESGLPKTLNIDYVRVYVKNETKSVKVKFMPNEMCYGSAGNMGCTYFPDVLYTWESPAFNFMPNNENLMSSRWAEVKSGIETNKFYPVTITSTFPGGYSEVLIQNVFISETPLIPNHDIIPIQQQTSCYYWAAEKLNFPLEKILWSEDFGSTWFEGKTQIHEGEFYSVYGNFVSGENYTLTIATSNACEISASNILNFTTPENQIGCLHRTTNQDVEETSAQSNSTINGNDHFIRVVPFEMFKSIINTNSLISTYHVYNLLGQSIINNSIDFEIETLESGLYLVLLYNSQKEVIDKFYLFR